MTRDAEPEPVIERLGRRVQSWATGQHLPTPYVGEDGRWRCLDCGKTLTRYTTVYGQVRLRHNPRGAR